MTDNGIPTGVGTPGPWKVEWRKGAVTRVMLDAAYRALGAFGPMTTEELSLVMSDVSGEHLSSGGRRQDRACQLLRRWGLIRFEGGKWRRCETHSGVTR